MLTKPFNPLSRLSIDDLKKLLENIEHNFRFSSNNKGEIENYTQFQHTYGMLMSYLYNNKIVIKKGNEILNMTYGEMAKFLIISELNDRLNNFNSTKSNYILDVGEKISIMDFIISEIDNELRTIESLEGSEIMGRKISLNFAKRITIQAKSIHKEESFKIFKAGQESMEEGGKGFEQYYNETFGGNNEQQ